MTTTHSLQLFGLDLRRLCQSAVRPWKTAYRWPLLAWMSPQVTVRLCADDGQSSLWTGALELKPSGRTEPSAALFTALALPEDQVLRRQLSLPALSPAEVDLAVALEVKRISPFAPDDVVHGHTQRPKHGALDIDIALASRKMVQQAINQSTALTAAALPEVWVLSAMGSPIVLGGFGEARRARYTVVRRRIAYLLLVTALLLLTAMAVTPTLQLRLQAVEAVDRYTRLNTELAAVVRQREAYLQAINSLTAMEATLAGRVEPVRLMALVTQALPDDTVLSSLQADGRKVSLSGQTNNTAELMQKLSTVPGIQEVRAPVAATRPLGATKETFTVEFTLDGPAAGQPATRESAPKALP